MQRLLREWVTLHGTPRAGILLCHGRQAREPEGFASNNGQKENGNVLGEGRENRPGEQLG